MSTLPKTLELATLAKLISDAFRDKREYKSGTFQFGMNGVLQKSRRGTAIAPNSGVSVVVRRERIYITLEIIPSDSETGTGLGYVTDAQCDLIQEDVYTTLLG